MSEKTMIQICIPFLMAVAVVVVFYILGFVLNIVFDFILDIGSVAPFFYLFGDYWDSSASTAGRVIAGILWIISTAYFEICFSEE